MLRMTLAAATAAALLIGASASAEVPPDASWTEHYIEDSLPFPAGEPTLHGDLMVPKGTPLDGSVKLPTVVSVGPYFAHGGSSLPGSSMNNNGPQLRWKDLIRDGRLFERGYALLQVDMRGFGGSQGCNDFGGRGEQLDVKRAIEWAAKQPWSNGKTAIYGKSYDGWTGVMALDSKPEGLSAAVIQSPIIDGYRTLYMDGLHYGPGWWATPALYQAIDATPPAIPDVTNGRVNYVAGFATGTDPACYATNIALQNGLQEPDDAAGFWKERALEDARGAEVPTFWSHGLLDINTKPDNFLPVYDTLKGQKRAWVGQFLHTRPNEPGVGRSQYYFDELFAFLDENLKGAERDASLPNIEIEDSLGRWRAEAEWPSADAQNHDLTLRSGTYADRPSGPGAAANPGFWSISDPVAHRTWLSGVPTAKVDVSTTAPGATLVVQLYDIDEDGLASLIARGGGKIRTTGAAAKDVELYPADYVLEPGHRLGARITGTDPNHWTPLHTGQNVVVNGGSVTAPFLTLDRTEFLPGDQSNDSSARPTTSVPESTIESSRTQFDAPGPLG